MKSNKFIFLSILLLFSCSDPVNNTIDFPIMTINAFRTGQMEIESNDVSYILNTTNLSPISVRLSWLPINRLDLSSIRIYKVSDDNALLLTEIEDVEKNSTTIDMNLEYENEERFQLTVVHEDGKESPLSNSNSVGLNITYGEPDDYEYEYSDDTLKTVTLVWSNAGNGLTNPIINVDAVRNNLLDSISMNVLYKENEFDNYQKIFAAIGGYRQFGVENSIGQGDTKRYDIELSALKTAIFDNFAQVVVKDELYFQTTSNDPYANLFKKEGFYEIFFYFYKRQNGRLYVYRSSLTETLTFPK
jgi:hypothetical protein